MFNKTRVKEIWNRLTAYQVCHYNLSTWTQTDIFLKATCVMTFHLTLEKKLPYNGNAKSPAYTLSLLLYHFQFRV